MSKCVSDHLAGAIILVLFPLIFQRHRDSRCQRILPPAFRMNQRLLSQKPRHVSMGAAARRLLPTFILTLGNGDLTCQDQRLFLLLALAPTLPSWPKHNTYICVSHKAMCGAIHWSVVDLLGTTSWRKTPSSSSGSQQVSTTSRVGIGAFNHPHLTWECWLASFV